MTLLGALQLGSSSLAAQQLGLTVTGNNITNASTPGYTRETLNLVPSDPVTLQPGIQVGTGVSTQDIARAVSTSLDASLRNATSDQSASGTLSDSLSRLQATFGTLNTNDIAAGVQNFFNQFSTLSTNPADAGQRSVTLQTGVSLASSITALRSQVVTLRNDTQSQIQTLATQADSLSKTIANLNTQIASVQGGGASANTLLDQRDAALTSLSQIMNVTAVDQGNGTVNVLVGSIPLVTGGVSRGVSTSTTADPTGQFTQVNVVYGDNGDPVNPTSGTLAGLINARDNYITPAIGSLDTLANGLIGTVNSISAQGQGLTGFASVTGTSKVLNASAALNAGTATTGLAYTPTNGTFNLDITDQTTKLVTTQQITVNLSGTGTQTSLASLAASLTTGPIVATVNPDGTLSIASNDPNSTFSFSNDTSGTLAALGINTIFQGSNAGNIAVNNTLLTNPSLLATGRSDQPGIIADSNTNAKLLAQAYTAANSALGGQSLQNYYAGFATNLATQASAANDDSTAKTSIQATISSQRESFSGVSLDEEAINLTKYQQAFQGTARYINVVNTFMDTVLTLIQ